MEESRSMESMRQMIKEYDERLRRACDTNSFAYTQAREKEIAREEGIAIGTEKGIAIGKEEGIAIGKEEGIAIGKEEGIAIGAQNAMVDAARKMKAAGLQASEISKFTGLTEEQVNEL